MITSAILDQMGVFDPPRSSRGLHMDTVEKVLVDPSAATIAELDVTLAWLAQDRREHAEAGRIEDWFCDSLVIDELLDARIEAMGDEESGCRVDHVAAGDGDSVRDSGDASTAKS